MKDLNPAEVANNKSLNGISKKSNENNSYNNFSYYIDKKNERFETIHNMKNEEKIIEEMNEDSKETGNEENKPYKKIDAKKRYKLKQYINNQMKNEERNNIKQKSKKDKENDTNVINEINEVDKMNEENNNIQPQNIDNTELNYLNEKLKFLEEKTFRLEKLNQVYYDIIKSTNMNDLSSNNNNNYFGNNNYLNRNNSQLINEDNYLINTFINAERQRNLQSFNDSMIDINQKITNYLIDSCYKEKQKYNFSKQIEDMKMYLDNKLNQITDVQVKQKKDIDYIIKYGLNKHNFLDPIIGLYIDKTKPIPKWINDEKETVLNKTNLKSFKNFAVYGRYSNMPNSRKDKDKGGVLRRSGSCIFENKNKINDDKPEYGYQIDKDEDPHKYDHSIYPNYSKRPIFVKLENKEVFNFLDNDAAKKNTKRKWSTGAYCKDKNYDYFIPADFKFGNKLSIK